MSTRIRSRSGTKSYTARLYQHTAASRRSRQTPAWSATRRLPALLSVGAECNHLAAAVTGWPTAPTLGMIHVLIAAALGLLAASVYYNPTQLIRVAGIGLTLAIPLGWLAGTLTDVSLYQNYPVSAALSGTVIEILVAGALIGWWHATAPNPPPRRGRQA